MLTRKKNNKLKGLLNDSVHKAHRFVYLVAKEDVFYSKIITARGSSALIVIYHHGLTTFMMQKIANNSNYPATVFLNKADISKPVCPIRWFNPNNEIIRCGHGTLAAANFLKKYQGFSPLIFEKYRNYLHSEKFKIIPKYKTLQLQLNCISSHVLSKDQQFTTDLLTQAIPTQVCAIYQTDDDAGYTTIIINSDTALKHLHIDTAKLCSHPNAIIVLQPEKGKNATQWRFRYFAPYFGVDEDSATGSAVSVIAPLIFKLRGSISNTLIQDSASGGVISYTLDKDSVKIS